MNIRTEDLATLLNNLIDYREKIQHAIDGNNEELDRMGDYDDFLLELIQKTANENDCVAILDSNSTPQVLSNDEYKEWSNWFNKTGEQEWYWTSYYMDKLRSLCEVVRFDYRIVLNTCRELIRLEINEPLKSGWMFRAAKGYLFETVFDIEDWFVEIVTDTDSDIDMILEACRRFILVHIQDVEKFLM